MKLLKSTIFLLLLCSPVLFSQPQQSEHFQLAKSVHDAGGSATNSANFSTHSAFGQPSPIGVQFSNQLQCTGGYLSPMFVLPPLDTIDDLVVFSADSDVHLLWDAIAGADSYLIYRSDDSEFVPDVSSYLGTVSDTTYLDPDILANPENLNFYIVVASRN